MEFNSYDRRDISPIIAARYISSTFRLLNCLKFPQRDEHFERKKNDFALGVSLELRLECGKERGKRIRDGARKGNAIAS